MVSNYCSSLGPLSSLEPLSLPHSGSYPFIKVISVKLFWVHHLSRILNISELGSSKHWDSCVWRYTTLNKDRSHLSPPRTASPAREPDINQHNKEIPNFKLWLCHGYIFLGQRSNIWSGEWTLTRNEKSFAHKDMACAKLCAECMMYSRNQKAIMATALNSKNDFDTSGRKPNSKIVKQ